VLSKQEEELERREVFENDRRVREQQQAAGSTFFQHGQVQADEVNQGRFAATGVPRVIGSTATVASMYPAASASHQTALPDEPPTGYAINEMPPLDPVPEQGIETSEARDIGGAPSSTPCEDVAAPPSSSSQERR
jgi:hypothetical protein